MITGENLLDLLYYKKLPKVYIEEDAKIGFPLKRYLESLIEGGFCGSIKDIEGLLSLVSPKDIPENFFQFLCYSFGLPYFPDIDVVYQRKILTNVGELIRRRGTYSCVHFLIRVLTGLESDLTYTRSTRILHINLLAKTVEQVNDIEISKTVIQRYIKAYIPYYVKVDLTSKIDTKVISSKSYSFGAVGAYKFYTIKHDGGAI